MDNKNVILAVVLSLAVLLGWNFLFPPQHPPKPAAEQSQPAQAAAGDAKTGDQAKAQASASEPLPEFTPSEGTLVTVNAPLYTAVFNTAGGVLEKFELKKYKKTIEPDSPLVDLVTPKSKSKAPMGLLIDGAPSWKDAKWSFEGGDLNLEPGQKGELTFTGALGDLRIKRTLAFRADDYQVDETLSLQNGGSAKISPKLGFSMASELLSPEGDKYNMTRVAFLDNSGLTDEADVKDLEQGFVDDKGLKWGAIESNYFLLGVIPAEDVPSGKAKLEDGVYRMAVEKIGVDVDAGARKDIETAYYLGPKEMKYLKNAPKDLAASINYGWFDFVAKPLIQLLHFFHGYVGNYGVAIIILTICIKLLFWPLSQKSYKSMDQMKKLQPMMAQIRERYKDDRQKMNEEMMRLYKTYKVNPAGGCLPMVVQIPVFIGLYQALLNAIELRHAVFIEYLPFTDKIWLADLSAKDPYYITPLIMGATMFLQQKMTPSPGDPTQAKIMLLMPVVFTFLFLNFPSGLVVYWLVNNVLSIAQQWFMLRKKS